MLIGAMNHPAVDVLSEIEWMAELQLGFIDLTLEPPDAAAWSVQPAAIRRALRDHGMKVVGHTAYYLPFASAFESLRKAAVEEVKRCLDVFAEVGARWMNLHPDRHAPMHNRAFYIGKNLESIAELQEYGDRVGVGLMIENLPGEFNSAAQLAELLTPMPKLGLHLDIGHANSACRITPQARFSKPGASDCVTFICTITREAAPIFHLPLGAGTVNFRWALRELMRCGFDETITLESVHT